MNRRQVDKFYGLLAAGAFLWLVIVVAAASLVASVLVRSCS